MYTHNILLCKHTNKIYISIIFIIFASHDNDPSRCRAVVHPDAVPAAWICLLRGNEFRVLPSDLQPPEG